MDLATVKRLVEARPFKPFKLVLTSDRRLDVPHPEFISLSPVSPTALVWHKDGGGEHVDLRLVVSVKTKANGTKRH